MYMYIYIYVYIYLYCVEKEGKFTTYVDFLAPLAGVALGSPASVVRGPDSRRRAKLCALELASVASLGPPVSSRL